MPMDAPILGLINRLDRSGSAIENFADRGYTIHNVLLLSDSASVVCF